MQIECLCRLREASKERTWNSMWFKNKSKIIHANCLAIDFTTKIIWKYYLTFNIPNKKIQITSTNNLQVHLFKNVLLLLLLQNR